MRFINKRSIRAASGCALLLNLLFIGGIVFAQDLEISYPTLPKVNLSLAPTLPEFIRYFYYFSIGIAGLITLASALIGGVKYLSSGVNPSLQAEAKAQIWGGVLGLLILLSSYLILTTVNPQLAVFQFQKTPAPLESCGDCTNPTTTFCKRVCSPVTSQKKLSGKVLEIPLGELMERVLDKEDLDQFYGTAKSAESLASSVQSRAQAYADELNNCRCSANTVVPNCSSGCSPLACTGDPCNRATLESKKKALESSLDALSAHIQANTGYMITAEEEKK